MYRSFYEYCHLEGVRNLPGERAHLAMAPCSDSRFSPESSPGDNEIPSAVLVLCSLQNPISILYTLRNRNLSRHSGQISFPGGRQDSGETLLETACRETAEEVGIPEDFYQIAGALSPVLIPRSNFIIHPWLAFCSQRPAASLDENEVSEVFWVKLEDLLKPALRKMYQDQQTGETRIIPSWKIHKVPLWGATAMITSELIALYQNYLHTLSIESRP